MTHPQPPQTRLSPTHLGRREVPSRENEDGVRGLLPERSGRQSSQGDGYQQGGMEHSQGPALRHAMEPPLLLLPLPRCQRISELMRASSFEQELCGLRAGGDGMGRGLGHWPQTNSIPETPPHAWGEICGPWERKPPKGQDLCLLSHLGGGAAGPLRGVSKQTARPTLNLGRAEPLAPSFFFLSSSLSFFLSLRVSRMLSCALLSCLKPYHLLLWVAYCPPLHILHPQAHQPGSPDIHRARPTPCPSGKLWQLPGQTFLLGNPQSLVLTKPLSVKDQSACFGGPCITSQFHNIQEKQ